MILAIGRLEVDEAIYCVIVSEAAPGPTSDWMNKRVPRQDPEAVAPTRRTHLPIRVPIVNYLKNSTMLGNEPHFLELPVT
jgi:hypothetical protein